MNILIVNNKEIAKEYVYMFKFFNFWIGSVGLTISCENSELK
jgi:hypothetical protein